MDKCYFCTSINQRTGLDLVDKLETDLFVVSWDIHPATPGHTLIIPKRHAQHMKELDHNEQQALIALVIATKEYIKRADLLSVYEQIAKRTIGTKSKDFIKLAITKLKDTNRPPEAFNDGLNDGTAAGQTVPHFHWHIMPRWQGDMDDPRGGIRHMFSGMGNYHRGISGDS